MLNVRAEGVIEYVPAFVGAVVLDEYDVPPVPAYVNVVALSLSPTARPATVNVD